MDTKNHPDQAVTLANTGYKPQILSGPAGNLPNKGQGHGHRGKGKKGRNFRWNGITHSVTKYRDHHHIGKDENRGGK